MVKSYSKEDATARKAPHLTSPEVTGVSKLLLIRKRVSEFYHLIWALVLLSGYGLTPFLQVPSLRGTSGRFINPFLLAPARGLSSSSLHQGQAWIRLGAN